VVTVLALGLGIVVGRGEQQRRAVQAIQMLDGRVLYSHPDSLASEVLSKQLLRQFLPRDYLDNVFMVELPIVRWLCGSPPSLTDSLTLS
jgi:hypothetical protein